MPLVINSQIDWTNKVTLCRLGYFNQMSEQF